MGKKSPSPPPPPDPAATAAAQTAANIDTAIAQGIMNRTNQISPLGTSTYNKLGETDVSGHMVPNYEQVVTLSPEQQKLYDTQTTIGQHLLDVGENKLGQVDQAMNVPLDFSDMPALDDSTDPYGRVSDAIYNQFASRLDPRFEQEQRTMENKLVNEGFSRGGEGWEKAMGEFGRTKNDAYTSALRTAITGAGAEQSRQFGIDLGKRQQAITEMLTERSQPINELATLMGTSGGVSMPSFAAPPSTGVGATDIIGPTYGSANMANSAWQTGVNSTNAANGQTSSIIAALGAAAIMASDPDIKEDKSPVDDDKILKNVSSLPVESWRYKGGDPNKHIGPYADDWAERFGGDGHFIDIPSAFGVAMSSIKALTKKVDQLERRAA